MRQKRRHQRQDADLDITSFLNLMIILVPVLLVMMVFSRITVIDLILPDLAELSQEQPDIVEQLEIVIRDDRFVVNYPSNFRLKTIPKKEGEYDFALLSITLQEIKRQLRDKGKEKSDAVILSEPNTSYQTLVSTYDTVRSFEALQAFEVIDAELFPDIALGDAP